MADCVYENILDKDLYFLDLNDDVKLSIISQCDISTVGRLSRTCKLMHDFINQNAVWIERSKRALFTNQVNKIFLERSCLTITPKEKCRISYNWLRGFCKRHKRPLSRLECFMPWIQLEKMHFWYSRGNHLLCTPRLWDGPISGASAILKVGRSDVVRFSCTQNYVVSGMRDSSICIWAKKDLTTLLFQIRKPLPSAHESDVNSVSCDDRVVVSCSRDKTLKVWSILPKPACQHTIEVSDNPWDVCILPSGKHFVCGCAAYNMNPLQQYDIETGLMLSDFSSTHKSGAGILHICPESQNEFLTCGYDSTVKLWDIRTPQKRVSSWNEINHSVVYCVDSDRNISFVSGSYHNGLICLWDKRKSSCLRAYYLVNSNSPVYSIAFDPLCLYGATDKSINMLNFSERQRNG